MATFRYKGGLYYLTGVFLAEAATVLPKEKELVEQLRGGVLTQLVWVRDLWNGCKTPMFKSVGGCCRLCGRNDAVYCPTRLSASADLSYMR